MTDTLERDLRAAFAARAAEVPDAPAPERAYLAPVVPHRRRWPLAVAGAAAAGAIVVGGLAVGAPTTSVADDPPAPTSTTTTAPAPAGALLTGTIDGRAWALVTDEGRLRLEADGLEGSFEGRFDTLRMDADPDFLFAQLGPCCRLGDHVLFVGALAPDATAVTVTLADGSTVDAEAVTEPGGYRMVVVPLPADGGPVRIEVVKADGSRHQAGPATWPLDQVGG